MDCPIARISGRMALEEKTNDAWHNKKTDFGGKVVDSHLDNLVHMIHLDILGDYGKLFYKSNLSEIVGFRKRLKFE